MSIQYMVLGLEPTSSGTWISSHNHQTRAPTLVRQRDVPIEMILSQPWTIIGTYTWTFIQYQRYTDRHCLHRVIFPAIFNQNKRKQYHIHVLGMTNSLASYLQTKHFFLVAMKHVA